MGARRAPDNTKGGSTRITHGPDGNLWFTSVNDDSIGRVTTADSLTVAPTQGPAGTPLTLSGAGFAPGETVNVKFETGAGAVTLCKSAAGAETFSCPTTVPATPSAGPHTITATGNTSGTKASTLFLVTS